MLLPQEIERVLGQTQILEQKGSLEYPRLFVFGDCVALFYSSAGAFLGTGRVVDGRPRFNPPIQVQENSKSSFVYDPVEGRITVLCGGSRSAHWLLDAKVEGLFRTSGGTVESERGPR